MAINLGLTSNMSLYVALLLLLLLIEDMFPLLNILLYYVHRVAMKKRKSNTPKFAWEQEKQQTIQQRDVLCSEKYKI